MSCIPAGKAPLRSRVLGRVLVTGASGLIGSRVLPVLRTSTAVDGLVVATRHPGDWTGPTGPDIQVMGLDLRRDMCVPAGVQTVVHLAGQKRDAAAMAETNEQGTRRLVEAAAASGVTTFVHLSSVGVYGAPLNSGRVTEDCPHAPANIYETTKSASETIALEHCRSVGVEAVVLQPSTVIACAPPTLCPLLGLVRSIRHGRFLWFGARRGWANFVDADDVATAIVAAAEWAPAGAAYIVNTPVPLCDAVRWIAEESGVDFPQRALPESVGMTFAVLGTALSRVTGRSMPFDLPRYRELVNDTFYDPARLIDTIGFRYPIGAERMIRSLARRYVQDGLA